MAKSLNKEEAKEAFIELWFRFFQLNTDYIKYCTHKAINALEEQSELDEKYPKIAEIYEDWGSILFEYAGVGPLQFSDWIPKHRHLFEPEKGDSTSVIKSGVIPKDSTVISVPHNLSKTAALEQIEKVLSQEETSGFHQTPKAKYEIDSSCKLNKLSYKTLRKILRVAYLIFENIHKPEDNVSNFKFVQQVVLEEELGWRWKQQFSDEDIERMKEDKMKSVELEDYKRQVTRYKKDAKTIVHNTLHGVFPVKNKLI